VLPEKIGQAYACEGEIDMSWMCIGARMQLLAGDITQAEESFKAFCCLRQHFEPLLERLAVAH